VQLEKKFKEVIVKVLLSLPKKYDLKAMRQIRDYRELCNPISSVGEGTYGHSNIIVHAFNMKHKIQIGKYCSIADNVHVFLGGNHHMYRTTTFPFSRTSTKDNLFGSGEDQFISKGDVIIGNDVHIGSNASIMSGLKIGNGSVVGAFAHVTRDVLPYEIVGGNPIQHIRFRFNSETIKVLLELSWWDWPKDVLIQNLDFLLSPPDINLIRFNESNNTTNE
jgi:acetyltransferase-like isoleucine patch superfamily enzyme